MNVKLAAVETINLGQTKPENQGIAASTSPSTILTNALSIIFAIGALAVLFFLIWGAFNWITSGGDKEKVAGARKTISNALIGLAILALAGLIVAAFGGIVRLNPFAIETIPTLGAPRP